MEQLRQTAIQDAELIGTKRRFGLFSQPSTIAIGDDSPFHSKTGIASLTQLVKEKMASQ